MRNVRMAHAALKQLHSKTLKRWVKALHRDGWVKEDKTGCPMFFTKTVDGAVRRVAVHYHPGYGPSWKIMVEMLKKTGWGEDDLRRLKPIR